VLLLGFQSGCYTFLPINTVAPSGADRIGVVLNDHGRIAMGPMLGPAVDIVEGSVDRVDSTSIRMQVFRVTTIGGGATNWTGEQVEVPRDGVAGFRERELSRARSWILAGIVVGLLVFATVVLGLDGLGGDAGTDPCVPPNCDPNPSIRW